MPPRCLDPLYAPWGLSDAVFYGPPAVASPAAGDRWRGGESYDIVWDPAGAPAGSSVGLTLWQGGTCAGSGGVRVAVVSARTLDDGLFRFAVPAGLPPRDDYLVQVTLQPPSMRVCSVLARVVGQGGWGAGSRYVRLGGWFLQ